MTIVVVFPFFFYSLEPLIDKTTTLLIQLPPFLTEKKGFTSLQSMNRYLDKRFRYSLEVRHQSWFNNNVYDFLKENSISLVWSVRDELEPSSILTSDQLYIRFIGDRSIPDSGFGKIVKDRSKELLEYAKRIRELRNEQDVNIKDVLIAFNNHFAGFGPQSVNDFLRLLEMPESEWKKELERKSGTDFTDQSSQSSLFDFTPQ